MNALMKEKKELEVEFNKLKTKTVRKMQRTKDGERKLMAELKKQKGVLREQARVMKQMIDAKSEQVSITNQLTERISQLERIILSKEAKVEKKRKEIDLIKK